MEEKANNSNFSVGANQYVECRDCHKQVLFSNGIQSNKGIVCNDCFAKQEKRKRKFITLSCIIAIVAMCVCAGIYTLYTINKTGQGFDGVTQISDSMNVTADSARFSFDLSTSTAVCPPITTQAPIANLDDFKSCMQKNVLGAVNENNRDLIIPSVAVMFEFNTNYFVHGGEELVKEFASVYLKTNKKANILVEGFTCDLGTSQVNFLLSKLRAEAIATILIDMGICSDNIEIKWYGKSRYGEFNYPCKSDYRRVIISIK